MTKLVEAVLAPPPPHWVGDGFRVHNFFPNGYRLGTRRMSPFFLLDYNAPHEFPPRENPPGVGVHPHRGFETVTIAYRGKVAHHDSRGHSGVIGEGDVQWMTAASGVLHKEYHEEAFARTGGIFQMVQLWVNLPSKHKMDTPGYQPIKNSEMGKVSLENNAGQIEVIAGEYRGTKGPAHTFSPIEMYNVKLNAGGSATLDLPENYNTGMLMIDGSATINGDHEAPANQFVLFKNSGRKIDMHSESGCTILLLSGEPLNEPVAHYGPFLMNTTDELQQAVEDFNAGKFGELED